MKIHVIFPPWIKGGLKTAANHIVKGLLRENYRVKVININEQGLMKTCLRDISTTCRAYFEDDMSDVVLYLGSIPLPGHVIYKASRIPTFLFIHGYTRHQLISTILSSQQCRIRLGAIMLLLELDLSRILRTINFYIAHSETVHKACKIPVPHRIVLPQFMFQEEIEELQRFGNKIRNETSNFNNEVKIVAYTSHSFSPRLLSIHDLITLSRLCSKRINRKIKLLLIDPNSKPFENNLIKIVKFLPRDNFLKELATSALYIETCVDDEIRYSTLEALALGTPVAKIIYPSYQDRIDYTNAELLTANSFKELVEKIADYIDNLEKLYPIYSKAGFNFVKTKRTWHRVKMGLIKHLTGASKDDI